MKRTPPSSCLDRYKKEELKEISQQWLDIVQSQVQDIQDDISSDDVTVKKLINRIGRLSSAWGRL
jgi:hypothetical protein